MCPVTSYCIFYGPCPSCRLSVSGLSDDGFISTEHEGCILLNSDIQVAFTTVQIKGEGRQSEVTTLDGMEVSKMTPTSKPSPHNLLVTAGYEAQRSSSRRYLSSRHAMKPDDAIRGK
jgi:hypothetical protein